MTYFIRINPNIEEIAREIHHAMDWQQAIFDDVTENGQELVWLRLRDSKEGPVFALYGEIYCCHAGPNWERNDGLFIFRVEDADQSPPRRAPNHYKGRFELSRGNSMPTEKPGACLIPDLLGLDKPEGLNIRSVGGSQTNKRVSKKKEDHDITTAEVVSERYELPMLEETLLRALRSDAGEVLKMWRPRVDARYQQNPVAFLDEYRDCWVRFHVKQSVNLSPGIRIRNILIEQTTPKALSRKEFDELTNLFGVDTIQRYVKLRKDDRLGTTRFLKRFGSLPLPVALRMVFWKESAVQLSSTDFMRELQLVCNLLDEFPPKDERFKVWGEGIRDAIGRVSEEQEDASLVQLSYMIDGVTNPLIEIQDWVGRLEFRDKVVPEDAEVQNLEPEEPEEEVLSGEIASESVRDSQLDDASLTEFEAVEQWILSQTVGEQDSTIDVLEVAKARLTTAAQTISQMKSTEDLLGVIEVIAGLHKETAGWMERLPEYSVLQAVSEESLAIYDRVVGVLSGEEARVFISSYSPESSQLGEAIELLEKRQEILQKLPDWLADPVEVEAGRSLAFRWLFFLLQPSQRRGMISLVKQLSRVEEDEESIDLTMISRPENLEDLDDQQRWTYFDRQFQEARDHSLFIAKMADDFQPWINAARGRGVETSQLKEMAYLLELLRPSVLEQTFADILIRVEEGGRVDEIEKLWQGVQLIQDDFGAKVVSQPLAQLDHYIGKNLKPSTGLVERSELESEISFRHDWVGPHGARATLIYREEEGHWWTSVPLIAKSDRQKDCTIRLKLDLLHGTDSGSWPPYNVKPFPIHRRIRADRWEWNRDNEEFEVPFELNLPFKKRPSTYLELSVQAIDDETGEGLGTVEKLKWESFSPKEFAPIDLDWAAVGELDYVAEHPIGVQRRSQELLDQLRAKRSVAVIAPRRFGKTTLVRYIQEEGEEKKLLVPEYVTCTSYQSSYDTELDYRGIWKHFSDKLQEEVGSSIKLPEQGQLPAEDAFDFARKAAKKRGYEALVFVFDEAQLLFPRRKGGALGDLLKDRLERTWGVASEEMVPVVFVLCGLPDFAERVPNLMGALQSFEEKKVREPELYSLILSRTGKRMQSTKAARKMLSDCASNLYVLRTMMEKLVEVVNEKKRCWFNLEDVRHVNQDLLKELENGSGRPLASYVRDCINEAESVNEWKPKREYPVALALAYARKNSVAEDEELPAEVVEQLNEWARTFEYSDLSTLKYDANTVREHIVGLRTSKILDGYQFISEFFNAWLLGVVNRGVTFDKGFSEALVRGALVHIRKPAVSHEVEGGSQASICRFSKNGKEFAYREIEVEDSQERLNFIQNLKFLHRLLDDAGSDEGKAYIYRLAEVGLAEEHPDRVVELYRWIDGRDLHGLTTLSPPLVAEMGFQLAKALRLIHSANILHRDLRPRNIILENQRKQPVLIDFGLARLENATGHTTISDKFAAPEVRQGKPSWTPAADVYSLGATLQELVSGRAEIPEELQKLLDRCTDHDLDIRPGSRGNDLVTAFEHVKIGLGVDRRKAEAWKELLNLFKKDRTMKWFEGVMKKFQPTLTAHALGLYPEPFRQTQVVADFLNQTVEACPDRAVMKLSVLENELSGGDSDAIRLVREMRNLDSHGHDTSDKRYERYSNYSDGRLEKMSSRAGEILGEKCGLKNLPEFVEWVFYTK